MKQLIKKALNRIGLDLVHYRPHAPLEVFEYVLDAFARVTKDFYFVQVGANDGVRWDPLRHAIIDHKIAGLCIEPLPDMFAKLQANYSGSPQLKFENVAVGPTQGQLSLHRFRPDADIPDYAHGMATFDGARLRAYASRFKGGADLIEQVSVPMMTFQSLVSKHRIGEVSLLQIDTEGYDFEILKLAFAAKLRPAMIHFEHRHLSIRDRIEACTMLVGHGYGYLDETHDILAMREDLKTKYA